MNSDVVHEFAQQQHVETFARAERLAAENAELRAEVERLRTESAARATFVNGAAVVQVRLAAELAEVRATLAAVTGAAEAYHVASEGGVLSTAESIKTDDAYAAFRAALASAPTDTSDETCPFAVCSYAMGGQPRCPSAAVQPVEAPTEEQHCEHGWMVPHTVYIGEGLVYHAADFVDCPGPVSQSEAPTGGENP